MIDLTSHEILILSLGAFAFGVYLLIKGGDWTVDAACAIAARFGLSPMIVGFTVVAFGTSLPEMVVTVNAHLKDMGDIAFGGVVGSNISNIFLILGASAVITPIAVKLADVRLDMAMMAFATLVLSGILSLMVVQQWVGLVMLLLLVGYTAFRVHQVKRQGDDSVIDDGGDHAPIAATMVTLLCGLIALAVGAEFLVRGAGTAARMMGVPELVIGLTLVAFGTSAPELAACVAAAMKKQLGMIVGNILGSNVFNIMSILGVAIMAKPVVTQSLSDDLMGRDMGVLWAATLALIGVVLIFKAIPRWCGFGFIGLYAAYIVMLGIS